MFLLFVSFTSTLANLCKKEPYLFNRFSLSFFKSLNDRLSIAFAGILTLVLTLLILEIYSKNQSIYFFSTSDFFKFLKSGHLYSTSLS